MSKKRDALEEKLRHYTGKAISKFKMIEHGDKVMVCLSGGKDSFTLLTILKQLQRRAKIKFKIQAFTLDQVQPGWDDQALREWLNNNAIPYDIITQDTYSIVKSKLPPGKTYC